jgi:hypothetical protein
VLDRLNVDDFAPLVGDLFAVHADSLRLDLELLEATTYAPGVPAVDESGARSGFTLSFGGPAEPVLAQQIVPLEHATLGKLDVFLVPVASDGSQTRYEAVFN